MAKLFISYAHGDKEKVRQLARELQDLGFDVWIDTRGLKGGTLWGTEIVKAITDCDFFLLFVSSTSVKSDNVRREVDIAHKNDQSIIPILLEDVEIPAEWDYQLAGIQWLKFGEANWKSRLLVAIGSQQRNLESENRFSIGSHNQYKASNINFCSFCGSQNPEDFIYCSKCGKLLQEMHRSSDSIGQKISELTPLKPGRSLSVFLCHSSGDKPAVRKLYHQLCKEKWIDPWLDEEKLDPGDKWNFEIRRAVRNADIVLVCISNSSINKEGFIQKEIRFALDVADEKPEDTIFIIPLKLEECSVPDRLSDWQWVNYYEQGAYERLMRSLRKRASTLDVNIENNE